LRATVLISLAALALLGIAWEVWLAPVKPGAWMLSLKVLPILLSFPALLRNELRAYQWWSMGILLYLAEGLVRAWSDTGLSASLALVEVVLSTVCFLAILAYCRRALKARAANAA
jgi:uncharacterized membrane protein